MIQYMAIGPMCWGRGSSIAAAKRNAKRHAPSRKTKLEFYVWRYDDAELLEVYVDGMGALHGTPHKDHPDADFELLEEPEETKRTGPPATAKD